MFVRADSGMCECSVLSCCSHLIRLYVCIVLWEEITHGKGYNLPTCAGVI